MPPPSEPVEETERLSTRAGGELKTERRKRGADVARAAIVHAAATAFAQRGYYGTTIDDIARESGYSPAAIYKYFTNKEALFSHLWNVMAEQLQKLFEESTRMPVPFSQRLRWLLSKLGEILQNSPDLLIAFIGQRPYVARSHPTELERQSFRQYKRHLMQLKALMEQGIHERVLGSGPAEDYANLFVGLLYEFAYKWVTAPASADLQHHEDRVLNLFLHGAGPLRGDK